MKAKKASTVKASPAPGNSSKLWISLGIIAVVALVIVLYLVFKPSANPNNPPNNQAEFIPIGDSAVLGEANAPVTIYEFSDFSCPYCEAAEGKSPTAEAMLKSKVPGWEAPVPLIVKNYVDTGKARIVFKYFPGHGAALQAHAVALGVKEQKPELFWTFKDRAMETPSDLSDMAKMKTLAVSLGADSAKLDAYITSQKYLIQLQKETEEGKAKGVSGTPTFFINGEEIAGAQPFSAFQKVIESKL
jgi:protein-disulfide isomerase